MAKYTVTITEEQRAVIQDALEAAFESAEKSDVPESDMILSYIDLDILAGCFKDMADEPGDVIHDLTL